MTFTSLHPHAELVYDGSASACVSATRPSHRASMRDNEDEKCQKSSPTYLFLFGTKGAAFTTAPAVTPLLLAVPCTLNADSSARRATSRRADAEAEGEARGCSHCG